MRCVHKMTVYISSGRWFLWPQSVILYLVTDKLCIIMYNYIHDSRKEMIVMSERGD